MKFKDAVAAFLQVKPPEKTATAPKKPTAKKRTAKARTARP
jgi:hypothetical protein